jgi:TonB family protein
MSRAARAPVFNETLLPDGRRRWSSFGASLGLEFLALTIVVAIPMLMPQKLEVVRHYWVMPVEAPHIEDLKPQPPKPLAAKQPALKEIPKPKIEAPVPPKPKIYAPVIMAPVAKVVTPNRFEAQDMPLVAKALPDAPPSIGSSAIPTLKKPREEVQTGGFGDPNGVPDNGKTNRNPNVTQLGSYDMPAGQGAGNGTGGTKGEKGVVASAGFGSAVAAGTAGSNHGSVKQGEFADGQAVTGPRVRQTTATVRTTPVEILFKPKPQYTDEARSRKIEGEVLLQVVFLASDEMSVERVVQGLGYGLDDSAESAARQIRFKPAQQDGQPVDSRAIVHITFQLAY